MIQVKDFSPLLMSIMERAKIPSINEENLEGFLLAHDHSALFFPGDWERLAESNDVAVVLPELRRLAPGLDVAVVSRDAERALQLRFRFNKFPALVFLRGTGYLGAILGMRDWSEYGAEIPRILARDVSEPPPYRLPDGCLPAARPETTHIH